MLKGGRPDLQVNTERNFQARNAKAYEVEILAAPSRIGTIFRTDRPCRSHCLSRNGCLTARRSSMQGGTVVAPDATGQPFKALDGDPIQAHSPQTSQASAARRDAAGRHPTGDVPIFVRHSVRTEPPGRSRTLLGALAGCVLISAVADHPHKAASDRQVFPPASMSSAGACANSDPGRSRAACGAGAINLSEY